MDIEAHFKDSKMDKQALDTVYQYILKNPGLSTRAIGRNTGLDGKVFKYRDALYAKRLITDNNIASEQLVVNRKYKFIYTKEIANGTWGGGRITLLANYLTRFSDDEVVPNTKGLTKKQVMDKIKTNFNKEEIGKMLINLQETLALSSIVYDDLSAFEDMIGINLDHFKLELYPELNN